MNLPKIRFPNLKPVPRKGLECLNCGQPLSGADNFCSNCGQKNSIKKLSFGVFVSNMFSGIFSYDSRFWRTFIPLLTKPGKISKEFIQGRRVKYVNPFQLYLNVSIMFFIILGFSNRFSEGSPFNDVIKIGQDIDSLTQVEQVQMDSITLNTKKELLKVIPSDSTNQKIYTGLDGVFDLIEEQKKLNDSTASEEYVYHIKTDTVGKINLFNKVNDFYHFYEKHKRYPASQALDSLGYKNTFWNKFYYESTVNAYKNYEQASEDGNSITEKIMSKVSIVLFIFLPVFTLFLMLIYIRRSFTYMEHLVFVFHTQTVFFLLLSIFYLLNFVVEMSNFEWVFIILFLIYLYKALRHFYGQGRIKTILKFILLNSYYMFLGVIGFVITAIATVLLF